MLHRLESIAEKKLIGKHLPMSLANNKTAELWKSFMLQRKEIKNNLNQDLISMQVYDKDYFANFSPAKEFVKWAAAEVSDFNAVPAGMETFTLPGGLYVVFLHKGPASAGPQVFGYIFGTWLPASGYVLDHRPHFEVLGEKYKNDEPDSEEEIWIPVRTK
ncbi:MAG: GyrI-like domain-containing protein [Cytophagaceae bacterium]